MEVQSDIAKWYHGKAVFITGATGFMGKALVEKLLRSCPDIGPIYVLVRQKREILPHDRVNEIMTSSAFDKVRSSRPDRKDWLVPICGEMVLPELGICVEDRRLLQEKVSVVFHLAATIRFNEPLKIAVLMNTEGTRVLLELCRGMTSLCAIVHVSTAYANCIFPVIEERVYSPPADLNTVKNCVVGLKDDLLELITPGLMGNFPNTYTFSKALAENVVEGYSTELPIVIVRPSIVSAAWREPMPGWVDGFNGPTSLVAASGKGLFKSMYGKGHLVMDLIPVDTCINLFIAAAWELGTREGTRLVPNVRVYNCISGSYKPIFWNEFFSTIDTCTKKYAMSDAFTSPKFRITDSRIKNTLSDLLELGLPAILADIPIRCFGGKPRYQRLWGKFNRIAKSGEFFSTHEFKLAVDNVEQLKRCLNPVDRVIFDFDVRHINWEEYITKYFLGIRRYVMNEKDDTIPFARQQIIKRTLITKAVQIGVFLIVAMGGFNIYVSSINFW